MITRRAPLVTGVLSQCDFAGFGWDSGFDIKFGRGLDNEQIGNAEIIVQTRPVNAATVGDQAPVRPFLRCARNQFQNRFLALFTLSVQGQGQPSRKPGLETSSCTRQGHQPIPPATVKVCPASLSRP
jgi:hypothetical protein